MAASRRAKRTTLHLVIVAIFISFATLLVRLNRTETMEPREDGIHSGGPPSFEGARQRAQGDRATARFHQNAFMKGAIKRPWVTLSLSPQEELAALLAFMTASSSNALPLDVNTTDPLDAGYILGFSVSSRPKEKVRKEIDALVKETWQNHPVVLFTKVSKRWLGREIV